MGPTSQKGILEMGGETRKVPEAEGTPATPNATGRRQIPEVQGSPAGRDTTSERRISEGHPANPAQGQERPASPHSPILANTLEA